MLPACLLAMECIAKQMLSIASQVLEKVPKQKKKEVFSVNFKSV